MKDTNLDHFRKITSIGKLQHYYQLIIFNKRCQVLDNVRMIEVFEKIDLFNAVLSCFGIHHFKNLFAAQTSTMPNYEITTEWSLRQHPAYMTLKLLSLKNKSEFLNLSRVH
jgi:hypothetical protein